MASRVTVVVATRNRRASLLRTLARLEALPERPPVIVVDNGSTDGSAAAVRVHHPRVSVVALAENRGATARNEGARLATTAYVAFADDDSWWSPGALARVADLFDAHPGIGLVAARVLLGEDEREDPTCALMAASPLEADPSLPGPLVLGFVACASAVRRSAFLRAGGFHPRIWFYGEEELLALDLAAAGWRACYVEDLLVHHHPDGGDRVPDERRRLAARNDLATAWMRRPLAGACRVTARLLAAAVADRAVRAGVLDALRGMPVTLRERAPVSAELERAIRLVEAARYSART